MSRPLSCVDGRPAGCFTSADAYAGDIAIAYGVTQQGSQRRRSKNFADHATHLVVHGVLHLAGYDHERPKDAKVMEPLEVKILKRLGIADPYALTSRREAPDERPATLLQAPAAGPAPAKRPTPPPSAKAWKR